MKYLYYYIFILLFIICIAYNNTIQEPFNNDDKYIILLGDSIFKNNAYVPENDSIDYLLTQKGDHYNYAQDGAIITDCYYQLEKIPNSLNNKNTTVYISVGGNDIINHYIINNKNNDILDKLLDTYKKLIKTIKTKMDMAKIVIADIYYPTNSYYKEYYTTIRSWNNKLYELGEQDNIEIMKVSKLLKEDDDFTHIIEPSYEGGHKIVDYISKK